MSNKTCRPAFPREDYQSNGYHDVNPDERFGQEGMSLRDYFASKSPITFDQVKKVYGDENPNLMDDLTRKVFYGIWALMNYEYADAMVEESDK